ncbi:MAG: LacI family DNA-binding transcriptional regulator [Clostridia bacterium]|nr:LacI family DNA-binding transcriptional regulator [Clostridia bacterium]MBQ4159151.1 LacI family DNA-binding transcriptional regulator [Clostridia bacterium]
MGITIRDVAAKCGLSISTVSKVFNNYTDISEETRTLVLRTAQNIGYYPSSIASALKTNRSYNLGVLFQAESHSGVTHSFFSLVLDALKTTAEALGYDITFINHNIRNSMTYLEHCRYRNVDGIALVCANFYSPEVIELVESEIPCVIIDHIFEGKTCILSENFSDMQKLTQYAIECGHKKIAFVKGEQTSVTTARLSGFRETMQKNRLAVPNEYIIESRYDNPEEGVHAFKHLATLPDRPTCIIMPDDNTALGALQAAAEMQLRVPQDISICGYDGIRLGQLVRPRLTTIRQDTRTMGELAAEKLIKRIERISTCDEGVFYVPGQLIPGESVGALK